MGDPRKTVAAYLATCAFACLISLCLIFSHDTSKLFEKSHRPINNDNKDSYARLNVQRSEVGAKGIGLPALSLFQIESTGTFSRLIKFNVSDDTRACSHRHFLIYTCRTRDLCGGWGDRLRGIITTFLMAQLTNRTFLIDMTKPCELSKLLRPNMYDWEKCLDYARTVQPAKTFHRVDGGNMSALLSEVINLVNTRVVRVVTNIQWVLPLKNHPRALDVLPWIHTLPEEEIVGSIIGILFKPSTTLSERLKRFGTEKLRNRQLVCSHIRTGKNPTIPRDDNLREGVPNITRIFDFLKTYDQNPETTIFVSTDSMDIRNKSRMTFSNYISAESKILHVDRLSGVNTNELCDGFSAALLDQLILARCDILVLTQSNFGTMAAYMRGESRGLFQNVKAESQIVKVNISEVKKGYKRLKRN